MLPLVYCTYREKYDMIIPITAQRNVQNIFGARQNWKDLRFVFMFPSYQKELKIVKMKIFCMLPPIEKAKKSSKNEEFSYATPCRKS